MAQKLGSFPQYNDKIFYSNIIKNTFSKDEIEELKISGLRNCSLVSIAPTGSISTMLGVSGGCEPEFAIKYNRKTESLNDRKEKCYEVYCGVATEYIKLTGKNTLPEYFVSSHDIKWRDRVDVQSIMQKYVDTAISSTVNLPEKATEEDVEQLYLYAWEQGLKGITVYRDGCKRAGILTILTKDKEEEKFTESSDGLRLLSVNDDLIGKKRKLITGCGSLHCLAYFDPETGDLLETYLSKGSSGGCNNFTTGLSRMISLSARLGCPIDIIVDQLNSCGTCPSYAVRRATKKDTSKGSCCPIAVGNALVEMYKEVVGEISSDEERVVVANTNKNNQQHTKYIVCPECGEQLFFEGGCDSCKSCGYSKCD